MNENYVFKKYGLTGLEVIMIYGASDDLVEFEGYYRGEHGYFMDEESNGILLACSDGTILSAKYGKNDLGVWDISVLREGDSFVAKETCTDEDAEIHSDVIYLKQGVNWIFAANDFNKVK
jgi:hypothetical protein